MAYTKLLNMVIEQSGLTVKEIAEKCVKVKKINGKREQS